VYIMCSPVRPGLEEPRCVEACPTGALIFGDLGDPNSDISRVIASSKTESLHPEYGLKEKVLYIGLPKRFIAGSVVFGDRDECAEGVKITLEWEGEKKTALTNNYGDFEFEGLLEEKAYSVKVEATGYKSQKFDIKTGIDLYLGDIFLTKAAKRNSAAKN
jgi:hypothetical protein